MWYINYKTNEEVLTMRKELLKGLTEEQVKKVQECKNSDEILALAKAEGVQLTDEQLSAISGGGCIMSYHKCPQCGGKPGIGGYDKKKKMHYNWCQSCCFQWYEDGTPKFD